MNKIGRKLYYNLETGHIFVDTGERQGAVIPTTVDQDVAVYQALKERVRETFDVLELEFGQYARDFAECNGYRVNPETKVIEFSYPDPNEPETEPVYQKPLSEQVSELDARTTATEDMILQLMMEGLM